MADKLQQTVYDYEGTAGGNVVPPLKINGVSDAPGKGANAAPGEADRYGGKGFAGRISDASKAGA